MDILPIMPRARAKIAIKKSLAVILKTTIKKTEKSYLKWMHLVS